MNTIITHTCKKCSETKPIELFPKNKQCKDGYTYTCKDCHSKDSKEDYQNNRDERLAYKKNYYYTHQEEISTCGKFYYEENREDIIKDNSKWAENNKDKTRVHKKKWRQENPDKIRELDKIYSSLPHIKIIKKLRSRTTQAIKKGKKSDQTLKLTGCTLEFLLDHLQSTAIKNGYLNFDIRNFSGKDFHIDHIIPLIVWNLDCSYHQKLACHWSNLQILDASTNEIKGDRLDFIVNTQDNLIKFK